MRKKRKTLKRIIFITWILFVGTMNLFALRLYLFRFDMDETLRILHETTSFSYEPIMKARILEKGTKENTLYVSLKEQIKNYGDFVYLTHLYTNHLWAEWGGIELPATKDTLFLVLRFLFYELKEQQPIINEDVIVNEAFFKAVDQGLLLSLSDLHEDHLMAHRIFHDLDYWKFGNHIGITVENTNYFKVIEEIPNGSLKSEKKRTALYRGVTEPKY